MSSPESLAGNVASWTKANAEYTDAAAARAWSRDDITLGVFGIPESTVGVLGNVAGLDVVELGCGTAYLSARLAKRGARVVGVDPTPAQLETARRMMRETGIELDLVEAPGESVPLPDSSFDLAISEYGACLWADPYKWVPEAARLLRRGGRLIFLTNSNLSQLCAPDEGKLGTTLLRPLFGLYRMQWPNEEGTEFHLPHGEWVRFLRATGFEVEALLELQAPDDATEHPYYDYVPVEWARKWPAEEIWVARKQ
ncbi:MAG TPA: methyltransferase domain-containing protein [Gaiellaceae bacterium]|nr:methyltransferase domain-containing protein [Gaiellaceae bacterium]